MSNPDSTADLTDVSNIQEVEEDLKEESEKNETAKKEVSTEKNCEEVKEKKGTEQEEGSVEPAKDTSQDSKLDAGSNHENNDVVEDCINLNLEDEENFDEVKDFCHGTNVLTLDNHVITVINCKATGVITFSSFILQEENNSKEKGKTSLLYSMNVNLVEKWC